ncbi:MAG: hypothetical protein ABEJ02_04455, partial [Candidatus Paceibacteria bacterium]
DKQEQKQGTNPKQKDTDGDGVKDGEDEFPLDATESKDTDGDGVGKNEDKDDDGDGLPDSKEKDFGTDLLAVDSDQDGVDDLQEYRNEKQNPDAESKQSDRGYLEVAKDFLDTGLGFSLVLITLISFLGSVFFSGLYLFNKKQ